MSDLQSALGLLFVAAVVFRQLAAGATERGLLTLLAFFGLLAIVYVATGRENGPIGAVTRTAGALTGASGGAEASAAGDTKQIACFQNAIAGRNEAYTDKFSVGRFNRLRFLPKNPALAAIAHDLRFVRVFDKARYADLLLYMEKFQKTYMYVLGDRYDLNSYTGTLIDLRDAIAETLYSLVFAIPATFKHTYGFLPYPVIQQNIETFQALSRKMLQVVENYARARGHPHFPTIGPRPYEATRPHQLP